MAEPRSRQRGRRVGRIVAGALVVGAVLVPVAATGGQAGATAGGLTFNLVWSQQLPDAGSPIAQSSPMEAALDGPGPSVVVGDRAGNLWAFQLSNGATTPGWPASTGGAPIDSTPSVAVLPGSSQDTVFVGGGNAADPTVGGYYAFNPNGSLRWHVNATDAHGNHGVQASLAVGSLGGTTAVVAPSLGQYEYALNASTGSVLPGWPFFTADSGFTTPSLVDLSGNGQTDVVEGGDSTAGVADGQTYTNGGHLRVLGPGGNLLCDYNTNQTVDSSPAVGDIQGNGQMGIVFGTGSYYAGASDTNMLFAANSGCGILWSANLGGNTVDSPALGEIEGNGSV
ncbi:MAG: hypothetical protein ACYCX8_01655, partial [Acidimicrobiales bacterium]